MKYYFYLIPIFFFMFSIHSWAKRKHKSGVWIITEPNSPQDVNIEHIEACLGNVPDKIDFKNKIYWIC